MKKLHVFMFALVVLFSFVGISHAEDKVSPETVDGATSVDAAKAKALFDEGVLFVDVRKDKDWEAGRIPDAVHIELKKKLTEESLTKEAKKDDPIVMYCNGPSCLRSSEASAQAVSWGFKKVYYFRGGLPEWKEAGYPVE